MNPALLDAVSAMNAGGGRFDVTIVCTTDDHQAAYWMDRLRSGLLAAPEDARFPLVLAVSEDWAAPGGAGNGLGTLYAVQKAAALAQREFDFDLMEALLRGKVSVALYHTAGKGTRMAPLPASENNNKPGVKLPFPLLTGAADAAPGSLRLTSVLEAVVKQTGIYAASRKGRLSVFWGDQVFLPSASFALAPTHHIDILCTLTGDEFPTPEEWRAKGLDKYGCIACVDRDNGGGRLEAAQVEKVSHETAVQMLSGLGTLKQVGPSLGSFSVSAAFLEALLTEFGPELADKTDKLDTDPHFWMPLTLPLESYVSIMGQKGMDASEASRHYHRVGKMKDAFDLGSLGLFGAVDVGSEACWWDYGQLKLYSQNSLLLLEDSSSSELLRKFLNIPCQRLESNVGEAVVDEKSYLFGVNASSGSIIKSVVANVTAQSLDLDGAIVVNCVAKSIKAGPGAILYNLIADESTEIVVAPNEIHVAVTDESGDSMVLKSHMDIDGGTAWKEKLSMNEMSFEEVHSRNKEAAITEIAKKREEYFAQIAKALGF